MTDFSAKSSFHCTNKTKTARSHWAKTIPLDRVIQRVLSSSFLLWLKLVFQNWPATTTAPSPTCVPWRDRNSINGERELCRKWVWPNGPELVWGHWVRICRPGLATNSFFSVSFLKKILICLEGKSMTPHRGNGILSRSSQQLLRLCLRPLKGFIN